jgi:hypothetical protein
MKLIEFSQHALDQLSDRGATQEEVIKAIREGEQIPAKKGRLAFRKNFPFEASWKGNFYEVKQVIPIVVKENNKLVVVTVYAFYFGGESK